MKNKMKPKQPPYSRGNVMENFRSYRIVTVLVLALISIFTAIHAAQAGAVQTNAAAAQDPEDPAAPEGAHPDPNCRYGVAAMGNDQVPFVNMLGAGWHLNFGISSASASNGAEFVHVITVKQNKSGTDYLPGYTVSPPLTDAGLGSHIANNPGALWIVGNEVDRGPDPGKTDRIQGDTHPNEYAKAYHDIYHFIKQRDPSALVANSALVQVTPGRLQYLDIVYQSYFENYGRAMPVDVWNMHLYVLPEVKPDGSPNGVANVALGTDPALAKSESYDPDGSGPLELKDSCPLDDVYCFAEHDSMEVFEEQVVAMRRWMRDHGYQHKPLLLSEYSLLFPYEDDGDTCHLQDEYGNCFTPSRVQTFMNNTLDYLSTATDSSIGLPADGNRLVQQWLWFSVYNVGVGQVSNLVADMSTGALSNLGDTFRNRVAAEPNYVNLYPAQVNSPYAQTNISGTASVTLTVKVANNGTSTAGAFDVTFYSDRNLNNAIGTATVPAQENDFPGMTGCATRTVSVSVPWEDLSPGMHPYWVEVDSGNVIGESPPGQDGEADNVRRGTVFVDADQIFISAVARR